MDQLKKDARIAGLLYLFVVLTGPFILVYVPGKLFVHGDAMSTARNILAHESLFRIFIVAEIIGELLFIFTVLALYRLLRNVGPRLAGVMVILILIDAPLAFLGAMNHVAALTLARGADILGVFNEAQRNALAMLFLGADTQGTYVSEVFWGLWLIPLGLLVYRSGFIPRLLGGWLIVNGLAYLTLSFTGLLFPQYAKMVYTIATPIFFGEAAFMLWLVIVGARARTKPVSTPQITETH